MPATLSASDVARYARDGFLSPNRALTRAQAAACRDKLAAFERAIGGPLTADEPARHRSRTHVLLTWVHALASHPALLDAVESLIGPNILVFTSTWFIKEPESAAIAAWHQDATYFGLNEAAHRRLPRPPAMGNVRSTTPTRLLEALQANGYAWVKSARKLATLLAPLGLVTRPGRENGRPVRLGYPTTVRRTGWLDLPLAERVSCRTQGVRRSAHPITHRG